MKTKITVKSNKDLIVFAKKNRLKYKNSKPYPSLVIKNFFEKLAESNGSGLNVDILASTMLQDSENVLLKSDKGSKRFYIGNESIKDL